MMMKLVRVAAINRAFPPDRAISGVSRRGDQESGSSRGNLQEFRVRAANTDRADSLVAFGNLQLIFLRNHLIYGPPQFAAVQSRKQ